MSVLFLSLHSISLGQIFFNFTELEQNEYYAAEL